MNLRLLRYFGIAAVSVLTTSSMALQNIDRDSLRKMVEHLKNFVESECKDPVGRWMAKDLADKIMVSRAQLPKNEQDSEEFKRFDEALEVLAEGKDEYDKARYLNPEGSWQKCKELYDKGAGQLEKLLNKK